jgi:hypothetical protein
VYRTSNAEVMMMMMNADRRVRRDAAEIDRRAV